MKDEMSHLAERAAVIRKQREEARKELTRQINDIRREMILIVIRGAGQAGVCVSEICDTVKKNTGESINSAEIKDAVEKGEVSKRYEYIPTASGKRKKIIYFIDQ